MNTPEGVPCVLCTESARRWRDRDDRLRESRIYRCAACGGRFAVTGAALAQLEAGVWDVADLQAQVRQRIAAGRLPRIEAGQGGPLVADVGGQRDR
ncbi:hypothetical protein [Cupriavidus sp. UYPR2.512]|uniref:hypothetical protein n=1 Tax=Cupriavidus sp. UYPR2.512 TaxID=1080187 RepID=UPI000376F890|nr:hypothetical protein [Cupriavidus sp. UYPR2.512]UIF84546.1 hypothetical protein KAF44_09475 [Cupriavidus necator]